MSFKLKLLLTFIVYGLSLVLFTQFAVFKTNENSLKSSTLKKATDIYVQRNNLFKKHLKETKLKLLAIKNSKTFRSYLINPTNTKDIESLFFDISSTSDNIMQLRYIDKNGMEKIRVDRDSYSSPSRLIPKEKLQNKKDRYYFKETIKIQENQFYYSKLDLNIEHGEIEIPINPVLRVSIPIIQNKEIDGILILNIFMKNFLNEFTNTPFFNICLINNDGVILIDSHEEHSWSEYIGIKAYITQHLENEDLKSILTNDQYLGNNIYSGKISLENGENIRMLIEPKSEYIQEKLSATTYELLLILIVVILISFPSSYFLSTIPARLKAEVDQQKSEQDVLLSLFDLSDAVLFQWNNDAKWSVKFVSKNVHKLLGYNKSIFQNNHITYTNCIHPDDLAQVTKEVTQAIESDVYFLVHKPYRVITKDQKIKWILDSTVIVRDKNNEIIEFVGYLTDITTLKHQELILKNISITDQLTRVFNRMHIDEILQIQQYRYNRAQELCSIILIDIDYFKSVNDEFGHLIGDKVLIEFANVLQSSIREGDTLGRWGGEEFLIILPHTNLEQTILLAQKLRVIIENTLFTVVKHKTASFGVASFKGQMDIENLIDKADKALYQSKKNGRNCVSTIQ